MFNPKVVGLTRMILSCLLHKWILMEKNVCSIYGTINAVLLILTFKTMIRLSNKTYTLNSGNECRRIFIRKPSALVAKRNAVPLYITQGYIF